MATYEISDATTTPPATSHGFAEYFELRCTLVPVPPDANDVLDELKAFVQDLAGLPADDTRLPEAEAADALAKRTLRTRIMQRVRALADRLHKTSGAAPFTAKEAFKELLAARGAYETACHWIDQAQFVVEPWPPGGKATDLRIAINSRGAVTAIPPEKETLYVALESAARVIKTVCERQPKQQKALAEQLLDEFIKKLAGVGRVGLQGAYPSIAAKALSSVKAEFFARQASAIKKRASNELGKDCLLVAFALAVPFFACQWYFDDPGGFIWTRRAFFLLAAGSAIGTWISFCVRSLDLTFDDLGTLDDDLLGPWIRIAFVMALTMTLGLMFWTEAFGISIGKMEVNHGIHGSTALLVGIFCGLSERALAGAISSRAATFVKGVAGTG